MTHPITAFRDVPYMGVIYVLAEAMKRGFTNGHADWCNLGQGQPEVGPIEGAPQRLAMIEMQPAEHAYGPVNGVVALRRAIAEHYNRLYRRGHGSQYTLDNVAVASGGRLALTRLLAALGPVRLSYQTPDYTAYEDMLAYHAHRVSLVHVPTTAQDAFVLLPERLRALIVKDGLGAHLVSNPCNPTGQLLAGPLLQEYVQISRETGCVLLLDEFYSHFIYEADGAPAAAPVSAAAYVEDVERDPVILVDGLTKNFRYPGWRVGWIVGPSAVIEQVTRAASAIDGGPSAPMQRAAMAALEAERADQETRALRNAFARKRRMMLDVLTGLGVKIPHCPRGTFYIWGDVSGLPEPYNNADALFRAALDRKVILVPGRFFDVNPGGARAPDGSYRSWMRFSFGPPEANVKLGLERLSGLLSGAH